uniref:Uncharacterized protein n=1 Tax=Panagrolaimus sp. ES5 TaxID=591445 RepID=A0AC34GQX3_9BILA
MLGMMNHSASDAVEFYSAPASKKVNEDTKVFVEHKEKKKVSYTEDGRKMIDGKIVESSDDEASPTLNPQQMWDKLIVQKQITGNLEKSEASNSNPSKSNKSKTKK